MSQVVTLPLPDQLLHRAQSVAAHTGQPLEAVLLDWLDRASETIPVDQLSDAEVLALADLQMDPAQQAELSDLLARNREGDLDAAGKQRLGVLMEIYHEVILQKSEGLREAVARGLRPPLG